MIDISFDPILPSWKLHLLFSYLSLRDLILYFNNLNTDFLFQF